MNKLLLIATLIAPLASGCVVHTRARPVYVERHPHYHHHHHHHPHVVVGAAVKVN